MDKESGAVTVIVISLLCVFVWLAWSSGGREIDSTEYDCLICHKDLPCVVDAMRDGIVTRDEYRAIGGEIYNMPRSESRERLSKAVFGKKAEDDR